MNISDALTNIRKRFRSLDLLNNICKDGWTADACFAELLKVLYTTNNENTKLEIEPTKMKVAPKRNEEMIQAKKRIKAWEQKFEKAKKTKNAKLLIEVMDEQDEILKLKRKMEKGANR